MGQTRDVFYNGCLNSDDFLKLSLRFFKRNWRMGYIYSITVKKSLFLRHFSPCPGLSVWHWPPPRACSAHVHCQRHWDAHSRTQKNPTTCRAGKTCARPQAKDKLRRGHAHALLMFCVQTERQSIVFGCVFSISDPVLQICQMLVNQGERCSSMS